MSIRQKMNENPAIAGSIAAVVVLIGLFVVGRQACGGPSQDRGAAGKAYFTADDGKTFFLDDASNLPPYTKDGKTAVRARVFKCPEGKEYVNHMERYEEADKPKLSSDDPQEVAGASQRIQVKKPGDKNWVSMMGNAMGYGKVITGRLCKDGNPAMEVKPPE